MEENKKMNDMKLNSKENAAKSEKMPYEQLENIAHQLSDQVNKLYARLQEADMNNLFKRLDYLFKVVENAKIFPEDFLNTCVAEIQSLITLPEEPQAEGDNAKDKPEE